MKKVILALVILIILAGGAFAIFHMSSKPASNASGQSASQAKVPAVNNAVIMTKSNSSVGQYLTDPSGRALYAYNADSKGVSNCTGACLSAWPAYTAKTSTANLPADISTITRKDNGQIQYTYKGMPLYYFASDSQGQVTGNGVENFSVAKPTTSSSSSSPSSSTPSQSNNSSSRYNYNY